MDLIGKGRKPWLLTVTGCCIYLLMTAQFVSAAPKLLSNAKAGDCAACHGKAKVLPDGHPDTRAMNLKDCQSCHNEGDLVLSGKISGSHLHQLASVKCVSCHGKATKLKRPAADKCVTCHGSAAQLAEKTANVKPENPHKSPHWGTEMECTICHHQHAKSENYCSYCHDFNVKVP